MDRPDDQTRYLWEEALKNLVAKYEDAKERRRRTARDLKAIEEYIRHIQKDINNLRDQLDM